MSYVMVTIYKSNFVLSLFTTWLSGVLETSDKGHLYSAIVAELDQTNGLTKGFTTICSMN